MKPYRYDKQQQIEMINKRTINDGNPDGNPDGNDQVEKEDSNDGDGNPDGNPDGNDQVEKEDSNDGDGNPDGNPDGNDQVEKEDSNDGDGNPDGNPDGNDQVEKEDSNDGDGNPDGNPDGNDQVEKEDSNDGDGNPDGNPDGNDQVEKEDPNYGEGNPDGNPDGNDQVEKEDSNYGDGNPDGNPDGNDQVEKEDPNYGDFYDVEHIGDVAVDIIVEVPTFEVKSVLAMEDEKLPQYWSVELTNTSTPAYINLAATFCDSILSSLKLGNPSLSDDAKCTNVTFTPVESSNRLKREVNATLDQNREQGIQGTANIEIPTPQAKELTTEAFTNIINSGIEKSDNKTGLKLSNVETKKTVVLKTKTIIKKKKKRTIKEDHIGTIIAIAAVATGILLIVIVIGIIYKYRRRNSA
ncbi:unnamed protein product [Schistosoma margrebowiei]|uniref:Uncharacterized protein n=1 Tax=Schistosoma margrebowiei TaxID=48269 RepID=A0AA85AJE5_9TREM|nr:unnamed protein product [Schistosoma margrebowiei]